MVNQVDVINKTIIESFSSLAFIDLVTTDFSTFPEGADVTSIDVIMPFLGKIHLIINHDLCADMAENIFGSSSEVEIKDALMESLNVIAGSMVSALYPGILFELGLPAIEKIDVLNSDDVTFVAFKDTMDREIIFGYSFYS